MKKLSLLQRKAINKSRVRLLLKCDCQYYGTYINHGATYSFKNIGFDSLLIWSHGAWYKQEGVHVNPSSEAEPTNLGLCPACWSGVTHSGPFLTSDARRNQEEFMVVPGQAKPTTTKILTHRTSQQTQERVHSDHFFTCVSSVRPLPRCTPSLLKKCTRELEGRAQFFLV